MHFTEKKINRNDPCWCGSGKKYKNCHEAFDEKLKQYEIKGIEIPPRKNYQDARAD
jgi:methionyl aminopeptidase